MCNPWSLPRSRLLQKQRLKHMNSIVIRDGLRNEMAKQQRLEEEMREKREQQKMDMSKLNIMINQGEEQMVKLRKRYEKNVQHRNDRSAEKGIDGTGNRMCVREWMGGVGWQGIEG